jgi:hypothetical protein
MRVPLHPHLFGIALRSAIGVSSHCELEYRAVGHIEDIVCEVCMRRTLSTARFCIQLACPCVYCAL